MKSKKVAQIRIEGTDRKGIIAAVTQFLFKNQVNIEDIDQRVHDDYLVMTILADYTDLKGTLGSFIKELEICAQSVGTKSKFIPLDKKQVKNVAILVTKEDHCLKALIKLIAKKNSMGKIVVAIGNHPDLQGIARMHNIPFFHVPSKVKKEHEEKVLELLDKYDTDLVVLARYMQILSPEFTFKYEGKIINIHPSLLPAFPGPKSYEQAFNKGVEVVGVTAHFATMDLDEGPIIAQGAFNIHKSKDTLENIVKKGRAQEARVLCRAVNLFLKDALFLRRGKVFHGKKELLEAEE
ncbi:formyltetrahydrofolate deformylase [bacterium]|nr:formyltetrahydrofolate deformylase [bacterium]